MMMRPEAVDHNGWVSRRKPERLGRMRPEADERMVGVGIGIAEECQNG